VKLKRSVLMKKTGIQGMNTATRLISTQHNSLSLNNLYELGSFTNDGMKKLIGRKNSYPNELLNFITIN
jgi:hypothetical protein